MTELQEKAGKLESEGLVARYKYKSRRRPAQPRTPHYTIVDVTSFTPLDGSVVDR